MRSLAKSIPRRERLLFLLAILGAFYEASGRFLWSSQTFNVDHATQLAGARSLLSGQGVSMLLVDPADFSSPQNQPILDWPPGYSWFLAPALAVFGDIVDAVMAVDCVSLLVLFCSWWWITYQLRSTLSFGVRLWLVGWWAAVASPAWHVGPNDIFSLAFFVLGIALTLRAARQPNNALSAAAGVAAGVAAAGRYAYWPLALAGPAATWIVAGGRRPLARQAAIQAMCGGGAVLMLYARNLLLTNHGTYLTQSQDGGVLGFFPEHLTQMAPFPASLIGLYGAYAPGGFLGSISAPLESSFQPLLWLVSAALVASAAWGLASTVQAEGGPSAGGVLPRLVVTHTVLAGLLTIAMLVCLSVLYPPQEYPGPGDKWVFVAEARYYMPLAPALFLGIGWFYERWISAGAGSRRAIGVGSALICVLALGPAAVRAKRLVELHLLRQAPSSQKQVLDLNEALNSQIEPILRRGEKVVYLDEEGMRQSWASMAGAVIVPPQQIGRLDSSVCEGATVIATLSMSKASDHMLALWEQLRSAGGHETGRLGDLRFMTYDGEADQL